MGTAKVSSLSPRRIASLLAASCALAGIGAAVPVAHAQEPGVVYEPGSPSGKEYAIPLEEARRDAGGARPGSTESLPFGIGISQRGRRGRGSASGGAARGRPERGGDGGKTPAPRGREAESQGFRERLADAEAADAASLWKLGPLLLVLLPALVVGLLLTRRQGRQPVT